MHWSANSIHDRVFKFLLKSNFRSVEKNIDVIGVNASLLHVTANSLLL